MTEYDAFISYSHAADGHLVRSLQGGLQKFAKAWYQLRALRLFRDETTLSLTPALWPSIEQALDRSKNFILMASLEAADSVWVNREVEHWLEHRGPESMYIVLTDGDIAWDDSKNAFDWECTDALPDALREAFPEEPLYLDLRWARTAEDLSLHNPTFRNNVADLAAALHGRAKDELIGDDVRQHQRTKRVVAGAVATLIALTIAALVAASIALSQRNSALSTALSASAMAELSVDPERSLLLSLEAFDRKPTANAQTALRRSLIASKVRARLTSISWPDIGGFSPDGDLGLVLNGGLIRVLRAGTGDVVAELRSERESFRSASFSPDGSRVIAATRTSIHIFDTQTWEMTTTLPGHEISSGAIAFSDDGAIFGTAGTRSVRIWRQGVDEPIAEVARNPREGRGEVVIDRSGRWFSFGLGDVNRYGLARVYATETGELLAELTGHESLLSAVAFSPDGGTVATASWDRTVRLWDTATWQLVDELRGHQGAVSDVAFSPDGRWLASTSWDRTARIWDAESHSLVYELRGHADRIEEVAFSTQGNVAILSSRDNNVSVWETESWRRVAVLRGHSQPLLNVAVDATGQHVLTASQDQTARLWAVSSDETPLRLPGIAGPGLGADTARVFSPNGMWVVTGGRAVYDRVRVWEISTGRLVKELDDRSFYGFSPDGALIVTGGGKDKPLHLRRTDTWQIIAEIGALEHEVTDVEFDLAGRWIVTADGYADSARIWDAKTGQLLRTLEGHSWRVMRAAFASDSSFLVTASYDKTARIWSTDDWTLTAELTGHDNELIGLDISRDGAFVATSSMDRTARIWDAGTGQSIAVLRARKGRGGSVRFGAADGTVLTTGDGTAQLWSSSSWRSARVFGDDETKIRTAALDTSGLLLVTTEDASLRVWDAIDGQELADLPIVQIGRGQSGDALALESAQFSHNGQYIMASSNGGNVFLYSREHFAPIEEVLALARDRTTRELTADEIARYLQ